jgi:hypothetical protein
MEKPMNNAMSAKMPMSLELSIGNKSSLLLSQQQVSNQVNNHSTSGKSTTISYNKHPRHQLPLSNNGKTINLEQIGCAPETSRGTLSEMVLKFTTLHKPT